MKTLEDKIKALMEAKEKTTEPATEPVENKTPDSIETEPVVKIENPMDPNLTPEDAKGQDLAGVVEPIKESVIEKVEEQTVVVDTTSIDSLLTEEFSDDFKLKAKVIFQAAVKSQVTSLEESLKEEYNTKIAEMEKDFYKQLEEKTKLFEEKTSDKIDEYLSYVAEEWTKENVIAIESGIRTELTEEFIDGLKRLFESSYVDLPESKVDLYNKAVQEKAEVEKSLMTAISNVRKLSEEVEQMKRENIIEESIKDFSLMDATRMKQLVEDFEFEDEATFRKKVDILKTSFFSNKKPAETKEQLQEEFKTSTKIVETEKAPIEGVEDVKAADPRMQAYLNAI